MLMGSDISWGLKPLPAALGQASVSGCPSRTCGLGGGADNGDDLL